ncbi:MAG: hypothetical protein C5S44_07565, partial [Candidatus Methanocomedens sp.]
CARDTCHNTIKRKVEEWKREEWKREE